jgi:hypothetical protein
MAVLHLKHLFPCFKINSGSNPNICILSVYLNRRKLIQLGSWEQFSAEK